MKRMLLSPLAILILIQIMVGILLSHWPSVAKEWSVRSETRGTLRVVDLLWPDQSAVDNYAEGLEVLLHAIGPSTKNRTEALTSAKPAVTFSPCVCTIAHDNRIRLVQDQERNPIDWTEFG